VCVCVCVHARCLWFKGYVAMREWMVWGPYCLRHWWAGSRPLDSCLVQ